MMNGALRTFCQMVQDEGYVMTQGNNTWWYRKAKWASGPEVVMAVEVQRSGFISLALRTTLGRLPVTGRESRERELVQRLAQALRAEARRANSQRVNRPNIADAYFRLSQLAVKALGEHGEQMTDEGGDHV